MAAPVLSNPTSELDGLKLAIEAATAGAIVRPVTVLHRDYDGFWPGPWPLVLLRLDTYTLIRISGGRTGLKGQEGTRQNLYTIEIHDALKTRDTSNGRVAHAQDDLYALIESIAGYFDHIANQGLPVSGVPQAIRAGEILSFKISRPYQGEDGGDVRIVAVGKIGVIGWPRPGLDP